MRDPITTSLAIVLFALAVGVGIVGGLVWVAWH